jgi:ribonuclease-3
LKDLTELENSIGYSFNNKSLLSDALVHKSYANEFGRESNEKLEFLGDSILEYISSKYIYNNFPNLREGEMTKVRAQVVCEDSLYNIAERHNFSDFLLVGSNEQKHGGNKNKSILADSVEAVIAAMYFDSGLDNVEKFIIENLKDDIEDATHHVGEKDHKSLLQEMLQINGSVQITYYIIDEQGPDHDKVFKAGVKLNDEFLADGVGKSKKQAEQDAAKNAIDIINNR